MGGTLLRNRIRAAARRREHYSDVYVEGADLRFRDSIGTHELIRRVDESVEARRGRDLDVGDRVQFINVGSGADVSADEFDDELPMLNPRPIFVWAGLVAFWAAVGSWLLLVVERSR